MSRKVAVAGLVRASSARARSRSITVSTIVNLTKTARNQGIEIAAKSIEWEWPTIANQIRALKTGKGADA